MFRLPGFVFALILPAVLFSSPVPYPDYAKDYPREIDFNYEMKSLNFMTEKDLEIWGYQRGLRALRDCPLRDLSDGQAAVIGPDALTFTLRAPGRGRSYLHLDFVSFRPNDIARDPLEKSCHPGESEIRLKDGPDQEVRYIEIFVNDQKVKRLYTGPGVYLPSPLVITLDRELIPDRVAEVRIAPSPGEPVHAIWDAFTSLEKE